MNTRTNFTANERKYRAEVEAAFAKFNGVVTAIDRSDKSEDRKRYLRNLAKTTYTAKVHLLRAQYGVDKDGREPGEFDTISPAKAYAPAHGGYPGTVVTA